jgi:hypothetical protein
MPDPVVLSMRDALRQASGGKIVRAEAAVRLIREGDTVAATIVPVAALVIGVNDTMKLFVITFAAFWPVLLNATSSVRSLISGHVPSAETLRREGAGLALRAQCPHGLLMTAV